MSILSAMLNASQRRCVEAQRLRRGLHASHPAHIFQNHGLDIGEVALWHDDIGHVHGTYDPHAPDAMLVAGHQADVHLRGPTRPAISHHFG